MTLFNRYQSRAPSCNPWASALAQGASALKATPQTAYFEVELRRGCGVARDFGGVNKSLLPRRPGEGERGAEEPVSLLLSLRSTAPFVETPCSFDVCLWNLTHTTQPTKNNQIGEMSTSWLAFDNRGDGTK